MKNTLFFTVLGYLLGSILFSRLYSRLFHTRNTADMAADGNPGTANAFAYGGLANGLFTLIGDLGKGFLPVCLYCLSTPGIPDYGLVPVMLAPVAGHLFPVFYHFQGGKGIAVTFGVYLGLWLTNISAIPLWTLIVLFLFFAVVVPVRPDLYLTMIVYLLEPVLCSLQHLSVVLLSGILAISAAVFVRLMVSKEPHQQLEVRFLWKH